MSYTCHWIFLTLISRLAVFIDLFKHWRFHNMKQINFGKHIEKDR